MSADHRYDYTDAGFNRFYRRSIGSTPDADTLASLPPANRGSMNFDDQQVSGAIGDTFRVGPAVSIQGSAGNGRISISDERDNEVVRLGSINDV